MGIPNWKEIFKGGGGGGGGWYAPRPMVIGKFIASHSHWLWTYGIIIFFKLKSQSFTKKFYNIVVIDCNIINKTNTIVNDCDIGIFLKNIDLKLQPTIQITTNYIYITTISSKLTQLHPNYNQFITLALQLIHPN